jgi:hypothetical protein
MRVNSQISGTWHIFRRMPKRKPLVLLAMLPLLCNLRFLLCAQIVPVSIPAQDSTEQKFARLTAAVAQAQAKMDAYQAELTELRQQLAALKNQMVMGKSSSSEGADNATAASGSAESAAATPAKLEEIQERQAIEESQIATHDVTKVETESKYPLKISGLVLFNAFVNTRQVDVSASPSYALPGPGSTGLSLRQTVLGLDARGPHLLGATSHADLRTDFFASGTVSDYAAGGVLRLRTAHAALDWRRTEAFVELDRSILEPNEPTSLVAIAQPELAWAGNLWTWNPQIGVTHEFALSDSSRIKAQAAFIDSSDPVLPGSTSNGPAVTETERSRWPGTEVRVAFQHGESGIGPEFGAGGYFSPHRNGNGDTFDAWAGTVDVRLPLSHFLDLTANAYRGQALAGLGAGGYVNYYNFYEGSDEYVRALDDVGGWAQLKARAGQRVEMNAGYGMDNPFAKEIQAAVPPSDGSYYPGLARNRSFYSNVTLSPSAYLLFSLEYRRLWTNFSTGPTSFSDVIGIGAGYKF